MIFVWMTVWNDMIQFNIMSGWLYGSIQEFTCVPHISAQIHQYNAKIDANKIVKLNKTSQTFFEKKKFYFDLCLSYALNPNL